MQCKTLIFFNIIVAIISYARSQNSNISNEDYLVAQGYNFGQYQQGEYGFSLMNDLNKLVNTSAQNVNLAFAGLTFAEFRLFTRSNPNTYVTVNTQNILNSRFNKSRDTLFLIHGWLQQGSTQNILNMKDAILSKYDMNVLIVHWGNLASAFYNVARFGINDIATDVADMMIFLNKKGQSMDSIHAVGFSLGAHIAGIAGKRVGGRIRTITGLDAAFPLYSIWITSDRLNIGDAQFVQVLHTTSDTFGFGAPLGNIDIYINGGKRQPGCVEIIPMCSHASAQVYFTNVVRNPTTYKAFQCYSFWQIILGYCSPTGISAPLIQFKPIVTYNGVFWATI